jgi:Cdc6-like AAA superfamily ATPase
MNNNPFVPQFGVKAVFVGRDDIINQFYYALNNLSFPSRTTIITGLRGSKKTAILSDVRENLKNIKNILLLM